MSKMLTSFYWFNSRPDQLEAAGRYILLGIALLSLIVFIVVLTRVYKRLFIMPKPVIESMLWLSALNFFTALALWFFDYELVPMFRARFWYVAWAIGGIIWIITIIRMWEHKHKDAPVITQRDHEIKKYLPN